MIREFRKAKAGKVAATSDDVAEREREAIQTSLSGTNLASQYQECLSVVAGFEQFLNKNTRPTARRFYIYLKVFFTFKFSANVSWREKYRELNSAMASSGIPQVERESIFYTVFMSRKWNSSLGALLQCRFRNYSFAALLRLARVMEKQRRQSDKRLSVRKLVAYTGAALAFLLQVTPEVIVKDLGWNYLDYQRAAFWVTVGIAAYVILIVVMAQTLWEFIWQRRSTHERLLSVLEYMSASRIAQRISTQRKGKKNKRIGIKS